MATKSIKINGQEYPLDQLSDAAKTTLRNIRVADAKLAQLQQEIALIQVARDAFGNALLANLPQQGKTVS